MFFFILSKTIISDKSSNKYLSLFVSGMIFYIILNYYINITKPEGFLEYINEYFYYLLVLDFIISISLLNNDQVESFKEEDDEEDDENYGQEKYSEEDKLKILQNLKNLQNKNNLDIKENNNEELFLKKENMSNEKKEQISKIVKESDEKEISKIKENLKNEEIEKLNNDDNEDNVDNVKNDLNDIDDDDNDNDIDIDIENENQNINVKSKNSEPLEDTELPIFDEK